MTEQELATRIHDALPNIDTTVSFRYGVINVVGRAHGLEVEYSIGQPNMNRDGTFEDDAMAASTADAVAREITRLLEGDNG